MDATTWVAVYAALVATGTLVWQIIIERKKVRPDVYVTMVREAPVVDDGAYGRHPGPARLRASVKTSQPATVTRAGVGRPRRFLPDRRWTVDPSVRRQGAEMWESLPVTVLPDRWTSLGASYPEVAEAGGDPEEPLYWWIRTSSGHRYRSDVVAGGTFRD